MATPTYWNIYKMFNDPPGHQELKCIKCRYASAGASSVVGLIGAYGVSKTMMANAYKGMGFVFVSLFGFGSAAVAVRMAQQDSIWNEIRIRETKEKMSRERKEFKESNLTASQ